MSTKTIQDDSNEYPQHWSLCEKTCLWGLNKLMLKYIESSGGFRGGALGASAPPAESMVNKS